MSFTTLLKRMKAPGRLAGLIAGTVCLLGVVFGAAVIAYTPKALLGGLLLFLGLEFLHEWVVEGRHRLRRADYMVVLVILAVIAVWGFLAGVAVGLALMCGLLS
jgi:sulfate permease, SulP family